MSRVIVDPVTRIEGHLRIEVETDEENRIIEAASSGTSFRGIEMILKGRDPREAWAFTQRFCGVCTVSNSIAAVRAVEHALHYDIPLNAQIIRNLMIGAQHVHDHVMHFYHLHALDWVDVVSALNADPAAAAEVQQCLSAWPNNSEAYFAEMQQKLRGFVEGGRLGIFSNAYWGHPGYKLPPEINLIAFCHFLEALSWQREVAKIHAIFGGKNPHPSFAVGGVPCAIDTGRTRRRRRRQQTITVNSETLDMVGTLIQKMRDFVDQVYVPDTQAIAACYKDWFTMGRGEGIGNFMTFGDFPLSADTFAVDKLFVPRGAIIGRDLTEVHAVDLESQGEIQEFINNSWYDYAGGKDVGLHPYDGETKPNYTGPTPPYNSIFDQLAASPAYTWLKAPRWHGQPMEVGPLARVLMLYATGHEATQELVNANLVKLKLPIVGMYSTMGRTLARTLETKILADELAVWYRDLRDNIAAGDVATHNDTLWDPTTWPVSASGAGFMEAPRGALAHWVKIENAAIDNYQAIIPTTWNAGPKDPSGVAGPYEASLVGLQLEVPDQPLEILRTIHSYDPCLACAVHVIDPEGQEMAEVKVL